MPKYPLIKNATINKTMIGAYVAVYDCPYCREELSSKETEIGEPDSCPHCRGIFKVDRGLINRIQELKAHAQEEKQRKFEERQRAKEQARQQRANAADLRRKQLVQNSQPPPQPRQSESPPQPTTESCPYCKETIKAGSVKCKHCGEYLDQKLRESRAPKVKQWEPVVALILSFLLPGAGQLYKGQVVNALLWFFLTIIGYVLLIVPGLVLHTCCVIGAAMGDPYKK